MVGVALDAMNDENDFADVLEVALEIVIGIDREVVPLCFITERHTLPGGRGGCRRRIGGVRLGGKSAQAQGQEG